jgi:hypothetical protein
MASPWVVPFAIPEIDGMVIIETELPQEIVPVRITGDDL